MGRINRCITISGYQYVKVSRTGVWEQVCRDRCVDTGMETIIIIITGVV